MKLYIISWTKYLELPRSKERKNIILYMYVPCLFSQILHAPLLITTPVFHFPVFELHSFLLPVVMTILNINSHKML